MEKTITIITPTFNRANLLSNCYKSLKKQTVKNFEWIIIDDGSEDNTREVVNRFIDENIIQIKYFKKENGGKHTAWNKGVEEAQGILTFILDSDDILVDNAIEVIINKWEKYKYIPNLGCLAFLRSYKDGNIIGDMFPRDEFISNHIECSLQLGISGDKNEVFITKVLKKYKFPEYKNEKFLGEDIVLIRIGREYTTVYINEVTYITEYLKGGLTKSGRKLRIQCPLGGMERSKEFLMCDTGLKLQIKHAIMYVCYGFFANKKICDIINIKTKRVLLSMNIISGYLLYRYWEYKCSIEK
ncbi:MAG: glycosyltransferase family 2 protein [Terrisporobacter sp.]|uniref:glycosyltransferase family 2 protein n=1 Tax=Terrisporobacter sp. TaxID=1965305 RepID=UPI0039A073EA